MFKEIKLTKGYVTTVDYGDYDFLSQWNWHAMERGSNKFYATRSQKIDGVTKTISMQNVIMPPPAGLFVDHINSDSLDNRRNNLRLCTQLENMRNRKPERNSSSRYKGVSFQQRTQYWKAYIVYERKYHHLGCYPNEDDAARAYNKAAIKYHGEFAKLNPVEGEPAPSLVHPYQHKWHESRKVDYV